MAARASGNRTHNDNGRQRRETGTTRRTNLVGPSRGRTRAAPLKRNPTAALTFARPLAGPSLELNGVPSTLFIGNSIPTHRLRVYEGIITHASSPSVDSRPKDTTIAYMARLLGEIERRYPDHNFIVEIAPLDRADTEYDDPDLIDENGMGVFFTTGNPNVLDISLFDERMRTLDPQLIATLVDAFARATSFTFDAFTPITTIEACEWHLFHGDTRDWYDDIRSEIAGNTRDYTTVSGKDVRAYIRSYNLRTPGNIRKQAGAHYARFLKSPNGLKPAAINRRINKLPIPERRLAQAFADAAAALARISKTLDNALTQFDRALFTRNNAFFAQPGLIIETTGTAGFICEIIDEIYQEAAQADGFGFNYVLTLEGETTSINRLFTTLERLENATHVVENLAHQIAQYDEERAP